MPLTPESKGAHTLYCRHCTDDEGKLRSRDYVQSGLAQFLKMLDETIDDSVAMKRAALYMQAMPAWAE